MDRPILFSGDMVKRILDGGKWQTRRTRGLDRFNRQPERWRLEGKVMAFDGGFEYSDLPKCPYGILGDRLWVKETYCPVDDTEYGGAEWIDYRATPRYESSHPAGWENAPDDAEALKWKSSRFMPRWASRIMLEITKVRVEKVQDISYEDALAEGIVQSDEGFFLAPLAGVPDFPWNNPLPAFASLWNSKNLKRGYGWDVNPWVWAIDFRMVQS